MCYTDTTSDLHSIVSHGKKLCQDNWLVIPYFKKFFVTFDMENILEKFEKFFSFFYIHFLKLTN